METFIKEFIFNGLFHTEFFIPAQLETGGNYVSHICVFSSHFSVRYMDRFDKHSKLSFLKTPTSYRPA